MANEENGQRNVPSKSTDTKETGTSHAVREGVLNEVAEQLIKRALGAKMLAASFGEMVGVLMTSSIHRHYSLSDLEWLLVPAFMNNQFTMAEARTKESDIPKPVGLALWATVSSEVDEKLSANLDKPLRMRPDEWSSGEILWLIDVIGPANILPALIKQLQKTSFKGRDFKMQVIDKDRGVKIKTVKAVAGVE